MFQAQKGFTLVELIVVITILAILWTIGFISFFWFQVSARDSVRLADITNISKSIELSELEVGSYPEVTNAIDVTFSGSTIWKQWSFGADSYIDTWRLSEIPTDPLTWNEYPYSKTTSTHEYQIWCILEKSVVTLETWMIRDSFAAANTLPGFAASFVRGNYNGKFISYRELPQIFILGVPSILSNETNNVTLEEIISNNSFIYSGQKSIPTPYLWLVDSENTGWQFTPSSTPSSISTGKPPVLYSALESHLSSSVWKIELLTSIKTYYGWNSDILNSSQYKELKNLNIPNDENAALVIVNSYITNNVWWLGTGINTSLIAQSATWNWNGGTSGTWWTTGTWSEEWTPTPPPTTVPIMWATDINSFVSVWKTDNSGQWTNSQVRLPLHSSWTYNFTVQWWDGSSDNITAWDQAQKLHTYALPWTYTIVIDGQINGFSYSSEGTSNRKMIEISQWWDVAIADGWRQFAYTSFEVTAEDSANFWSVVNADEMFYYTVLSGSFNNVDLSSVTSVDNMFSRSMINSTLSNWNLSSLVDGREMFAGWDYDDYGPIINASIAGINMTSLNSGVNMFRDATINIDFATEWPNVSNIVDGNAMFYGAKLNTPFTNVNLSSVTIADGMFWSMTIDEDITNLDLRNVTSVDNMFIRSTINGTLSNWNLSSLVDGREMFAWWDYDDYGPVINTTLAGLDISGITSWIAMFRDSVINSSLVWFDTTNIGNGSNMFEWSEINIDFATQWPDLSNIVEWTYLFYSADLNTPFTNVNLSSVTTADYMFWYMTIDEDITNLNLSSATSVDNIFTRSTINGTLSNWNLSSLVDGREMFAGWDYDDYGPVINTSIAGLDTGNITAWVNMFRDATINIDFATEWPNVSNIADANSMFYGAKLNTAFTNVNLSSATTADSMFWYMTIDEDITNLDLRNVTSVDNMFIRSTINGTLSNWNLSSLVDGREMFAWWDYDDYGPVINTSIAGLDTGNITAWVNMFRDATINIDFATQWSDVSNILDANYMFYGAKLNTPFSNVDLSSATTSDYLFASVVIDHDITNLNFSSVTSVDYIFYRSTINSTLSNWNLSALTDGTKMFAWWDYDDYGPVLNSSLAGLDTSNITNGAYMFRDAKLNVDFATQWVDVSNVSNAYGMFFESTFNTAFSNVDISSATNADAMFGEAIISQNITNLNLASATSVDYMFKRATINGTLSNWNISSLTDGTKMFASGDYDNYWAVINSSLAGLDFSWLTNMTAMFRDSTMDQDISWWNSFISSVTSCSKFDEWTPSTWTASEKPTFTSCSV